MVCVYMHIAVPGMIRFAVSRIYYSKIGVMFRVLVCIA